MKKGVRIALLLSLLVLLGLGGYFILNSGARPMKSESAQPKPSNATRSGAWVDEVVFREEGDPAKDIDMMEAGEIPVYDLGLNDAELSRTIERARVLHHGS